MNSARPGGDPTITSLQNPRVKAAVRLRARQERDETGLTIVDGARELRRAIAAGVAVVEAFVCPDDVRSEEAREAVAALPATGARLWPVSPEVLGKVAFGERAEGVVAVVRIPSLSLVLLELPDDPLIGVVEGVEKPGNLGAVLRSADGAGLDALIAADPLTDPFNPNTIRASLGTVFHVPLATATTTATLTWLRDLSIRIVATRVDADRLYTDVDLRGPLAIVLGSEAAGLSGAWDAPDVEPVRLPMSGIADSLNVSAAAAAIFYEARRQRGLRARR